MQIGAGWAENCLRANDGRSENQMNGYIAVVQRMDGGLYKVIFPDLPGCRASGMSVEEALAKARGALKEHAAKLQRRGIALPSPRPAADVISEEAKHNGIAGACIQLRDISVRVRMSRAEMMALYGGD